MVAATVNRQWLIFGASVVMFSHLGRRQSAVAPKASVDVQAAKAVTNKSSSVLGMAPTQSVEGLERGPTEGASGGAISTSRLQLRILPETPTCCSALHI